MPKRPIKLSNHPVSVDDQLNENDARDPLSDIVDTLRLSARVIGAFEFSAPFALRLAPRPEADVVLLMLLRGSAAVATAGVPPATLSAGDLMFQVRTHELEIRDDSGSRAPVKLVSSCPRLSLSPFRGGGDGAQTTFVGVGFRMSAQSKGTLLAQLPPMLVTSPDASPALAQAAALFRAEASSRLGGSRALLSRLGEIIFIDFLRREGSREGAASGDLKALADPSLARAIERFHANPSAEWTVESLGSAAGLSRSAFALRFHAKVGEPPLHYVLRWRMTQAAQLLVESDAGLGEVAAKVGYRSEASFNRAFARILGLSPGAFRRKERAALRA
jgi:AraC-like DNA-binding protein